MYIVLIRIVARMKKYRKRNGLERIEDRTAKVFYIREIMRLDVMLKNTIRLLICILYGNHTRPD